MKRLTAKSALTRAQIIRGALRALAKKGVTGTTTRMIAAEANVQLAALHYHFDSKSALLVAVLETLVEDIAANLHQQRMDEYTDLNARIEQLIYTTWRSVMKSKDLQIVQYELTLYALREGAEWLADRQYSSYLRVYRDYLVSGSAADRPVSLAGYTSLARFILAGVDGLILQELAKPNRGRSKQAVDALVMAANAYARELAGSEEATDPREDAPASAH